ncbi:uncharacterized protein SCODWIG_03252 [Saccharomycodes ludwigii]|uniref:PA14 domain-containing protein n=1 Tax=Saccharomycodes ludwigii TaxID=36035 RepID=A0A376BA66_9ASCO|nr:uncharacterized protein SCODWIG_03252 [Saccharomycodes ludwigii]
MMASIKQGKISLTWSLLTLFFTLATRNVYATTVTEDDAGGCIPTVFERSAEKMGFHVQFYHYNFLSYNAKTNTGVPDLKTYVSSEYINGGFADYGMFGETYSATNLSFKFVPNDVYKALQKATLPPGFAYSEPFYLTNWTFLATGYFVPPTTGVYKIGIEYIDDLGIVSFGANSAFECCLQHSTSTTPQSYQISSLWSSSGPSGVNEVSVTLNAGIYYPLRIFYVNRQNIAGMNFGYTDPDGVYHNDWSEVIYNFKDSDASCDAPSGNSTTYIPWTGSVTSTIGTSIFTTTGSDHTPTTSTIYTVETPEHNGATTTYTPWTGSVTSTIGTSVFTTTGSDGIPTTSTIYTVETPEHNGATTTYTPWTGSVTSTIDSRT